MTSLGKATLLGDMINSNSIQVFNRVTKLTQFSFLYGLDNSLISIQKSKGYPAGIRHIWKNGFNL